MTLCCMWSSTWILHPSSAWGVEVGGFMPNRTNDGVATWWKRNSRWKSTSSQLMLVSLVSCYTMKMRDKPLSDHLCCGCVFYSWANLYIPTYLWLSLAGTGNDRPPIAHPVGRCWPQHSLLTGITKTSLQTTYVWLMEANCLYWKETPTRTTEAQHCFQVTVAEVLGGKLHMLLSERDEWKGKVERRGRLDTMI